MTKIRSASPGDIDAIYAFDTIAQTEPTRRAFIDRAVRSGQCVVIENNVLIVAYGVLEYTFFECGFISMMYVHPQFRHQGFGEKLVRYLEGQCRAEKLFTSTNQSNLVMQRLLEKLGYQPSGIVENLDEDDPELIYFKRMK
jgi:ribosomal protein S18 acetylase RimI-like enzyme